MNLIAMTQRKFGDFSTKGRTVVGVLQKVTQIEEPLWAQPKREAKCTKTVETIAGSLPGPLANR
jgi:hypothetical protein